MKAHGWEEKHSEKQEEKSDMARKERVGGKPVCTREESAIIAYCEERWRVQEETRPVKTGSRGGKHEPRKKELKKKEFKERGARLFDSTRLAEELPAAGCAVA